MVTLLLARLERAKESARQECTELSGQMEQLQERLAVAQVRLERLSIAREELTALEAADEPADAEPGKQGRGGVAGQLR